MRVLVLSDLHLEFDDSLEISTGVSADVVVLAGDIAVDDGAVAWARARFACPVVFVAGNHEFYQREMRAVRRNIVRATSGTNVHFLDDAVVVIEGVRFVGATLWTDFELHGKRDAALAVAQRGMSDFQLIHLRSPTDGALRGFRAADSAQLHAASRSFIERTLSTPHDGPTVVVTHHLPSSRSVAPRWGSYPLNAAFASNLDDLIVRLRPTLWIHGHTHDSFDYVLGETRVVCNPRGYVPDEPNRAFDPGLVITV